MPTNELAKQADAVRADIAKLEADLKTLLHSVGGGIGDAVSARINGPLSSIAGHIEPLLALLAPTGDFPIPFKRGPGRPKMAQGDAPKRSGRRRGGRGKKANLTPEAIQAALKQTGGNKSAAARALGVSQPTFYKYLGAGAAEPPKPAEKKAAAASKKATAAKSKK